MDSHSKSVSVIAQTVRRIETDIKAGCWQENERLPSERALAETLGVSRATVREAIARLASKGLVETRRGSGVYLLGSRPARLVAPWLQLIADTQPLREEMFEFRLVFECAAVRFAAQRASRRDHERLESILAKMRDAVARADVDSEAATDVEFHAALTAACRNRLIEQFYASAVTVLREHISSNTYDATLNNKNAVSQARARLRQHESIYFAVRDGDPDAAQGAMLKHIHYVEKQFSM
ncbi:FadR family transcriptional regulator [Paraburkholderia sp. Ac-20336]|uniref:FadR/GntR family transcriptional regulator n=1 Tax=Burkholderiaceae TaxID=119060 RepID=UPI001423ED0B|nr:MULTISPECIES: FadR/GntR family transcriptional regulator [Burkholderiaceae]MBN3805490.1 FadR family transcriptional regulator [Paraburkholderia sp. Ac-20336]MBN3849490.1 FadR family transcriptional regulator [Paraburkholderia sp. Ac-20342]NIF52821.1 FadR family transcriptional regulator [Burkholderia sp. Ax-1724]NIF78760.1 FadR family transcriptional regulator [Paraburkholderia sp. Cy-641]